MSQSVLPPRPLHTLVFTYVQNLRTSAANANHIVVVYPKRADPVTVSCSGRRGPPPIHVGPGPGACASHPTRRQTGPSSVCDGNIDVSIHSGSTENTFSFFSVFAHILSLPSHPRPSSASTSSSSSTSSAFAGGDSGGARGAEARESNKATSSQFSFVLLLFLTRPSVLPSSLHHLSLSVYGH